jgi:ACR3 family arsenite transporter
VAINSILQIVLFSPLSILFINVISPSRETNEIAIDYSTVAKSVAAFLGASSALSFFFQLQVSD